MRLVDVHAHLDYPPLSERLDEVLKNAKEKGVKAIVSNGTNPESNRKVLELSKNHDIIKASLGFYPTHVQEVSEEELDIELKFIESEITKGNVIAIGEVGLDKKFAPEDNQPERTEEEKEKLFKKQVIGFKKIIALAERTGVPIIIHSRKAELDVIELLEQSKINKRKIIMHCFSGKKKLVARIRENGWTFSVPVIVTKLQQFQELVRDTPINQLLTETDAPYLGPEPGLTNESANVDLSIRKFAELKGMTPEEMADNIFLNYMNIFL